MSDVPAIIVENDDVVSVVVVSGNDDVNVVHSSGESDTFIVYAGCEQGPVGPKGTDGIDGEKGDKGDKGDRGDVGSEYRHVQMVPSNMWVINHNLNRICVVTIIDSAGTNVEGEVTYFLDNLNTVTIRFDSAFAGEASCI